MAAIGCGPHDCETNGQHFEQTYMTKWIGWKDNTVPLHSIKEENGQYKLFNRIRVNNIK